MVALLVGDTLGICVKRGCILAHWSSDGGRTYKFISASPPMGSNGDSPCLHTTTASVTTWLVEVRKSGFENIDNWKCAFTCFLSHLLRRFKWKNCLHSMFQNTKKGQNVKLLKHFWIRIFIMFGRQIGIQTNVNLTFWPCIHIQSFPLLSKRAIFFE